MTLRRNKPFWVAGSLLVMVFLGLLAIRLGMIELLRSRPKTLSISPMGLPPERETWMNIWQNDRKIGVSHSEFTTEADGYGLQETVRMRINTMGMVQDIHLRTRGRLNPDFSLADFDFEINSSRFSFSVKGAVAGERLKIQTASAGSTREMDIKIKSKPYLLAGITAAMAAAELNAGDKYIFDIFDPSTMGQTPVEVNVIGREDIRIGGSQKTATKVSLNFKGAIQIAWIGESGEVLKEKGILGIRLEKTTREDALFGLPLESSEDLTRTASIPSNVVLENLERRLSLKVEISGVPFDKLQLDGGRQTISGSVLSVTKESTANLAAAIDTQRLHPLEKIFLRSTPFVQSDDEKIRILAQQIAGDQSVPLEKVRLLVDWMQRNIEKRPVLSLPDALSTLEHRVGDCNEHAVLLAALARSVGIPCRIEAGLVYLKGRFYYHAWNLVYLGRWITVDSLFGQLPADVSHLRFVTGSPKQQLDLMGIIGNIQLKVIN